jgi:predicted ribosome quality control (RQC) complex YloA/Tae2 family protein
MILDSIKHVSSHMSSVREVLPGREYFIPKTQDKSNPLTITQEEFLEVVCKKPCNISRAIYTSLTGLSPVIAEEICYRASIDGSDAALSLDETACIHLYHTFSRMMEQVAEGDFTPNIVYRGEEPVEYGVLPFSQYGEEYHFEYFDSVSAMLETYYASKNTLTRIRQKSSDLRRIVQTALERNRKKLALQEKQMKDTAKKDKYKVYGELINTYGYGLEDGCKSFTALNYYTNEEITIPLDPTMSPAENAKKYFDKYGKLKRTEEALTEQLNETQTEIDHLESISNALDIALAESDLAQIKEELTEYGYIKRHYSGKKGAKMQTKSKPFHYVSSDGFDIYVGKNNYQNDELTFKFATGNDWWFHAKKMAGSHVVVRTRDGELPDRTFEEAGRLAAYYSKGRTAPKVEIDYIQKKQVKKPAGAKPGFVVYYTNYSLMAEPDISGLQEING